MVAPTLSKIVPEPVFDSARCEKDPKGDRVHAGKNAYAVEQRGSRRPGMLPDEIAHLETPGMATVHVACLVCLAFCMLLLCELDATLDIWELSGDDQRLAVVGASSASFTCALASCCLRLCRRRLSSTKTKCICSVLLLIVNACFASAAMLWPDEEQRAYHFAGISFMFKVFALTMAEFRRLSPSGSGCWRPSMMAHSAILGSLVIDVLVICKSTLSAKTCVWPAIATILAEALLWNAGSAWKRLQVGILKYFKDTSLSSWDITTCAFSFASDAVIILSSDGRTIENWDARFKSMIRAGSDGAGYSVDDWLLPLTSAQARAEVVCVNMKEAIKMAAEEQIAEYRCLLKHFGEVELCLLRAPDESHFVVGIKEVRPSAPEVPRDSRKSPAPSPCVEDSVSDDIDDPASSLSSSLWRDIDSSPVLNRGKILNLGAKEHWLLDSDKVQIDCDDVIGRGGFGEVYGGTYCGTRVAIKVAKEKKRLELPLLNELQLLRYVRHPNIVLYFGACVDPVSVDTALVFEFVDGETLSEFISKRPSEGQRMTVVRGVSLAVAYLHGQRKPIVHGDLKGGNVFVEKCNDSVRAKVADFGISKRLSRTPQRSGGTIRWTAPEILRDGNLPAATTADIYSFGCLLSFVVSFNVPFSMYKQESVSILIRDNATPILDWRMQSFFEQAISILGKQCAVMDPSQRLNAQEIISYLKVLPSFEDEPGGESSNPGHLPETWISDCAELLRTTRASTRVASGTLPDDRPTCTLGSYLRTPPASPALP
eukprot:TRINITY_DN76556_c0_g1_i1.p1 TRINITY_DN76556_c0_g1~~TRINITY_DN76556_c0_g1_i1.p1  ORF type:complete len:768 (+),score=123.80 TRINITY_DN76556_c0_g1_i1:74-2377(+)